MKALNPLRRIARGFMEQVVGWARMKTASIKSKSLKNNLRFLFMFIVLGQVGCSDNVSNQSATHNSEVENTRVIRKLSEFATASDLKLPVEYLGEIWAWVGPTTDQGEKSIHWLECFEYRHPTSNQKRLLVCVPFQGKFANLSPREGEVYAIPQIKVGDEWLTHGLQSDLERTGAGLNTVEYSMGKVHGRQTVYSPSGKVNFVRHYLYGKLLDED